MRTASSASRKARATGIQIKRIYDDPIPADGVRVLVDRLWPRGVTKERAHLDEWFREIAPSPALREWFDHDPKRFAEFRKRYQAELKPQSAELAKLKTEARTTRVTLLYAAHDPQINHAVVLKEAIEKARSRARPASPVSPSS
jgi:uncharacterized protein YeaO (DUF488 family)